MDGFDSINGCHRPGLNSGVNGQHQLARSFLRKLTIPSSVLEETTSRYEAKVSRLDEKYS